MYFILLHRNVSQLNERVIAIIGVVIHGRRDIGHRFSHGRRGQISGHARGSSQIAGIGPVRQKEVVFLLLILLPNRIGL